ncbi:MAG: DNA repair protein RecO [Clostridiales Family XIII bacterium]|jgi:DNA repair protein RecO (recombination protein O)|nr:DNA repair protein RecO [Clostridiales Family XIII bacterium]
MDAHTEGIVLKQTKTLNGRRMLTLFSKEYGKIGAGTGLAAKAKSGSSLALRPFTYGIYGLRQSRGAWHMNSAEVLRDFFRLAEEPDRFANCSYALEFTEKLLPEEAPAPALFALVLEYFEMMEGRRKKFDTLTLAFLFKAIHIWGAAPEIERCARCGKTPQGAVSFGVRDGGIVCDACMKAEIIPDTGKDRLLYPLNFDILNVMRYIPGRPLRDLERLALDGPVLLALKRILREHAAWHLGLSGLKSEEFFNNGLTIRRKEPQTDGYRNHP